MNLEIALIRGRYDPFGGAERFVQNSIEALAAQGARLTIVTRKWPANVGSGGSIEPLIVDPFYLGSAWRDRGFARAACAAIATRRFDLVQSHERIACCDVYRAGDGVHAEWLAQRARVLGPLARMGVRLNPHHRQLLDAERKLFASARLRAVICNSRMVRDEIVRYFDVPVEKLRVIYNSVDVSVFHPGLRDRHRSELRARLAIPPSARVFLFVGSGFERKGLAAFLAALAKLPRDSFGIVVGKDRRMDAYRALAARLGIVARVRFSGGVTDVRQYYGASDVFVLPTLYDPFPNACLEAMACALPIVTSGKCGAAELIENGRNGYVCDALATEDIAAAMRICANDSDAIGTAGRATVAAFTAVRMAGEYLALYRELLGTT